MRYETRLFDASSFYVTIPSFVDVFVMSHSHLIQLLI